MYTILFFIAIIHCIGQNANPIGNNTEHYIITIQGIANGYITVEHPIQQANSVQGNQVRKTRTAIKTKVGSKNFDDQLLEETIYQNDWIAYSWEKIWQNQLMEQQRYIFEKNQVKLIHSKNGKEIRTTVLPIPNGTVFLGDYFSFLPLLERAQKHPITVSTVDLKQISPESPQISLQPMVVKTLGNQKIVIHQKEYATQIFQVELQNTSKNGFHIWLEAKTKKLLQIQDLQRNMKIALGSFQQVQELSQMTQQSYFKKTRPLPYRLGQTYHYQCLNDKKHIGDVYFTILGPSKNQSYYEIVATGKFPRADKEFTFQSTTHYDENYNPIFYTVKEGEQVEITCEFTTQGVREIYRNQDNILEYFIPITPDTIFLDNSAIHHFIMFLCQTSLEPKLSFSMSIFHPRRLQINPAKFRVVQAYPNYRVVELETSFHTIQMKVGLDGLLYEYMQGKIQVQLMDK